MEKLIDIYNSNDHNRLCRFLLKRLEDSLVLIQNLKKYNKKDPTQIVLSFYREIFDNTLVRKYISFSTMQNNQLSIKIICKYMLDIDKILKSNLSKLLDTFKDIYLSISDADIQLKDENRINLIYLSRRIPHTFDKLKQSNRERDLIDRKARLKKERIQNFPLEAFYHLTHYKNLKSIFIKGLISHNQIRDKEISNKDYSNNKIKNKRNRIEKIYGRSINDYVPLYFNPKNPFMLSKGIRPVKHEMVLIEILPHILKHKQVLFSDGNAADKNSKIYQKIENLDKLKWKELKDGKWTAESDSRRIMCSEVLVAYNVGVEYIQRIIIGNKTILPKIISADPSILQINTQINSDFFI